VSAVRADAETVDTLARLQLLAHRRGSELLLRNSSPELLALIAFSGLERVLRVEPGGQAEEREQPLRVEEEGELGDPAVGEANHLQRPGIVPAACGRGPVLPEGRESVRRNGRKDP
jgi:hypothetical protein